MATATDVLRVLLTGDASGLKRAFGEAQTAGDRMVSMGRGLSLGVTLPLVALGGAAVNAASNLEAAAAKVDQVFGDAAGEVHAFAQTTTEAFGISERAALDAAGTYGNLFITMGFGEQAAAGMSSELLTLAGDLAAFHNIGTDEVLEKIRSGLVGEIEPLRALGVNFDAATVAAEAMTLAVADGRDEITNADTVAARFNLILEQTAIAQGQAGREADSLASQQARARAEMENSAAAIGAELLPAVTDAVSGIADLAEGFGNLPQPVQSTVVKVGLLAAAMGPALYIGGRVAQAYTSLATVFRRLGPGTGGATGVAVLGIGLVVLALQQAERRADAARARFEGLFAAMRDGSSEALANEFASKWGVHLVEAGLSATEMAEALAGGQASWDAYIESLADADSTMTFMGITLEGVSERQGLANLITAEYREHLGAVEASVSSLGVAEREGADELKEKARRIDEARNASDEYSDAVDDTTSSVRRLERETGNYLTALEKLFGLNQSVQQSQIDVQVAYEDARAALEANGATWDITTEAGRENRQVVLDVAEEYFNLARALEANGAPAAEVNDVLEHGRQVVTDLLTEMGIAPMYIDEYVRSLGLIPRDIDTEVTVDVPKNDELVGVGRDMSAGIAQGIDEGQSFVSAAIERLMAGAVVSAKNAGLIKSPSQLFAEQVGGPISEGVAQGILDAMNVPESALVTLFERLISEANTQVGNITSGVGTVFAAQDASANLETARNNLNAALESGDPEAIAKAQREQDKAQLALINANQRMIEAGQELIAQGPAGQEQFRQIAAMSGLTPGEADALLAQLLPATSWAGALAPSDVSGLIGGDGSGHPAIAANIVINMPPGSNGDDVVQSLQKWQRQNGAIPIMVTN